MILTNYSISKCKKEENIEDQKNLEESHEVEKIRYRRSIKVFPLFKGQDENSLLYLNKELLKEILIKY